MLRISDAASVVILVLLLRLYFVVIVYIVALKWLVINRVFYL